MHGAAATGTSQAPANAPDRASLLSWYRTRKRDLPWRRLDDPYAIWVSEVMLQQTRVDTVIPYFLRWMERFPTVQALADADEAEVLHAWQGLGYYSRARALHKAARVLTDRYEGRLPRSRDALLALPGIGPYTAGAIASIAFAEPVAAVDGNVSRVVARQQAIDEDVLGSRGRRRVEAAAEAWVPRATPGDWNQALMELGATVCLPRRPRCDQCPIRVTCMARVQGRVDELPVRRKPRDRSVEHHVVLLVTNEAEHVLLCKETERGLLHGLWRLPMGTDLEAAARDAGFPTTPSLSRQAKPLGEVHHVFTHKEWRLRVHHLPGPGDHNVDPRHRWVPIPRQRRGKDVPVAVAHEKALSFLADLVSGDEVRTIDQGGEADPSSHQVYEAALRHDLR